MIAQLHGTIVASGLDYVILDVAGIGYLVHTSRELAQVLSGKTEGITLFTHLSVRETSLELYGFSTEEEMRFFELLISVSGIGPKSGLAIMNLETVPTLSSAILQSDTTYLTKVSGIGKKSAEKIIIELRDKIASFGEDGGHAHAEDADTLEALLSLGYSRREAREALKEISEEVSGASERLTEALKLLGK
ncbi:MAG: Holliday junction branch migration protein RuvA [Candidatus Pacebacteria bacterium]|nr:Holliday junction branch migration protein RuvA [Candidatus Paceibacterota bacterium]